MPRQSVKFANVEMIDAISRFLASPPEGTPAEVIEAFDLGGENQFLPPQLFLETVEQAPVAISITDPAAKILYVNSAFERLTGYPRSEIVGLNESVLSSKSTPLSVYQALWETIQAREVWQGTLVNHRKNREEYLAELVISPVLNTQNQIVYYLGMHRDVTEMHQLEQRLKFQKELTETLLDAVPMAMAMVDSERRVLLDNHAYKALLGDLRGVEPATLFLDALEQQMGQTIGNVCTESEGFRDIEIRLDSPGGSSPRWFSCTGLRVPELDEAAHNYFKRSGSIRCCLLLIAHEVTESRRRINDARLNMIRTRMVEQQMVQTMREAISGAMFKLQVPLNVVRAALAMPGTGAGQGLEAVLQQALESGDQAMQSLKESLPTPSVEQFSTVNINEIVHQVISLSTETLIASGIVIDWKPVTVMTSISGRANALRGLFKYLIDNSITALNQANRSQREIRIETREEQQELVVAVMDNGCGLENQYIKAFEPFYSGWSQPGEHAGMGLTMAREVAISHGGSIDIDPDFMGGCRIYVRLPLTIDKDGS